MVLQRRLLQGAMPLPLELPSSPAMVRRPFALPTGPHPVLTPKYVTLVISLIIDKSKDQFFPLLSRKCLHENLEALRL